MDRLSCIEYFLAVADAGGFSAAAQRLGTAPSAPIRAVATLERALSVQLFQRTTRRVVLTPEGASHAARCRAIVHDLKEAEQQLRSASSDLVGLIRVTAPVMLGSMHVSPLIAQFLREHPRLVIDLQLSDRIVDLVDQSFDLAVRIGEQPDSTMLAVRVASVERVLCASATYWNAHGTPTRPRELRQHRSVHYDGYAPHAEWAFIVTGTQVSVQPNTILTTNYLEAARQACVEGLGCGMFLSYQVDSYLRNGQLIRALARYAKPALPVSVFAPPGRLVSLRVATLKRWLVAKLKQRLSRRNTSSG
jgi:DNA-binding transcriptional LysR family regulator